MTGIGVDPPAPFVTLEDSDEDLVQEALRLAHVHARAGELDRRLDQLLPGHLTESSVRLAQSGEQARDRDRPVADVIALRRRAEVHREVLDLAQRLGRDGEEAVEKRRPAANMNEQEAATGRPGQRPLGHERRAGGRDARVDGVSTAFEHPGARLGGQGMACSNRASHEQSVKLWDFCR